MAVLVISYARADRPLVRGIVQLLKAGLNGIEDPVFWDEDFEPGEPWFEQMQAQIDAAPRVFVFWCEHAARSEQVQRELGYAAACHKKVVPVLLDQTPLPICLAPIHAIDLRDLLHFADEADRVRFSTDVNMLLDLDYLMLHEDQVLRGQPEWRPAAYFSDLAAQNQSLLRAFSSHMQGASLRVAPTRP